MEQLIKQDSKWATNEILHKKVFVEVPESTSQKGHISRSSQNFQGRNQLKKSCPFQKLSIEEIQ